MSTSTNKSALGLIFGAIGIMALTTASCFAGNTAAGYHYGAAVRASGKPASGNFQSPITSQSSGPRSGGMTKVPHQQ